MSDAAHSDPSMNSGSPPRNYEESPNLWVVEHQGRHRPFFDPENLPAVEDISLDHLKKLRKVDYTPGADSFDAKEAVRFLAEAAEGTMEDSDFEAVYSRVVHEVLGSVLTNEDRLEEIYDVLDKSQPRIMPLMRRVHDESALTSQQFVTINKMCLIFTILQKPDTA